MTELDIFEDEAEKISLAKSEQISKIIDRYGNQYIIYDGIALRVCKKEPNGS